MSHNHNDTRTRPRTLSMHSIKIYIDTEKRQSVAQCSGYSYRTIERTLKKINANPKRYQHQQCVIIHIMWTSYIWWIVLTLFLIVLPLILFFLFYPGHIWLRNTWLYLCIAIGAFIIIAVIVYYIIQHCDKTRWIDNELNRIHVLIAQSNTIEYSDKHNPHRKRHSKRTKKKFNWTEYTDSESDHDENNMNNLHYIYLSIKPLSKQERSEDVIKMIIEVWLEEKEKEQSKERRCKRPKMVKQISDIPELESKQMEDTRSMSNGENVYGDDAEMDSLLQRKQIVSPRITPCNSDVNVITPKPSMRSLPSDEELLKVSSVQTEEELQCIVAKGDRSDSD